MSKIYLFIYIYLYIHISLFFTFLFMVDMIPVLEVTPMVATFHGAAATSFEKYLYNTALRPSLFV